MIGRKGCSLLAQCLFSGKKGNQLTVRATSQNARIGGVELTDMGLSFHSGKISELLHAIVLKYMYANLTVLASLQ